MITYQYKCNICGVEWEEMQRITDKPLTKCLICKGYSERIISKPSVLFKGKGWAGKDIKK